MANLLEPRYTHFPVVPIRSTPDPGPATFERPIGPGPAGPEAREAGVGAPEGGAGRELVRLRPMPPSLAPAGP